MDRPDSRAALALLAKDLRPELHRYAARLTGSVIEGEDVVQEALTRAWAALDAGLDLPALRPWLFRVTHHVAVDLLRRHGRRHTDLLDDMDVHADAAPADPAALRGALARYLALPLSQRAATVLKDVLDHSIDEIADLLETTPMAVKALLVRGRRRLADLDADATRHPDVQIAELHQYAALFNARDWDGLRALLTPRSELDLVDMARRTGPGVGEYFGRYAREAVTVHPALLDGQPVLAARVDGRLAYPIVVTFDDDGVATIRDLRYVPYIGVDAAWVLLDTPGDA